LIGQDVVFKWELSPDKKGLSLIASSTVAALT